MEPEETIDDQEEGSVIVTNPEKGHYITVEKYLADLQESNPESSVLAIWNRLDNLQTVIENQSSAENAIKFARVLAESYFNYFDSWCKCSCSTPVRRALREFLKAFAEEEI